MCTKLGRYAFISYLIHSVWCQGTAQLTFSSNPVYNQELVTLTCGFGSLTGVTLIYVAVEAFSRALTKDSLLCKFLVPASCIGVGLFGGKSLDGWPNIPAGATNFSLTLTATPSLEVNYTCMLRVTDGNSNYNVASAPVYLQVFVLPSPPTIAPVATTFNQSDSPIITCESLNGKPAANVSLTVTMPNGTTATSSGIIFSSLSLPFPISDWHNAMVICSVANHNFSYMIVTKSMMINHIRSTVVRDVVISTNASGVTLNCSTYVRSYPGALYNWRTQIGANFTVSSDLSSISLQVPQGQSGSFNCSATNIITMENVMIAFIVSNVPSPTSGPISGVDTLHDEPLWVIGLVLGIVAVVTISVVLFVLRKRGHFPNGKKEPGMKHSITDQRSRKGNPGGTPPSEQRHYTNAYAPSIDGNYESLNAQPTGEPTYAQLTGTHRLDDGAAYENF